MFCVRMMALVTPQTKSLRKILRHAMIGLLQRDEQEDEKDEETLPPLENEKSTFRFIRPTNDEKKYDFHLIRMQKWSTESHGKNSI